MPRAVGIGDVESGIASGGYVRKLTCVGGGRCQRSDEVRRLEQPGCDTCLKGWTWSEMGDVVTVGPPEKPVTRPEHFRAAPPITVVTQGVRAMAERLTDDEAASLRTDLIQGISVHLLSRKYRLRLKTVYRKRAALRAELGLD